MEYLSMFIEGIMDSLEEFFDAMTMPTAKYVSNAFIVSVLITVFAAICYIFNIWCFVSWQEGATCSVLLLIVTLVDSSTRQSIKGSVNKVKDIAKSRIHSNAGYEDEVEVNEDGTDGQ